jgi:AbrB family looped-hinge helix DNA binding protein
MRVTPKNQVTIPQPIREKLGMQPGTEVDFVEEGDRVYLVRRAIPETPFRCCHLRGVATAKLSTEEIMSLTRG